MVSRSLKTNLLTPEGHTNVRRVLSENDPIFVDSRGKVKPNEKLFEEALPRPRSGRDKRQNDNKDNTKIVPFVSFTRRRGEREGRPPSRPGGGCRMSGVACRAARGDTRPPSPRFACFPWLRVCTIRGFAPFVGKLKYPLVDETAICYSTHRQDIRRRLAERPVAPTEWNTTVVADEAMCPRGKHVPVRSRVLITRCATVRLRGDGPFLKILARQDWKGCKR